VRFYDLMTLVWAALWGAAAGVVTYALASSDPEKAWVLGAIATMGMVLAVWFWRVFKDPG
jgi:hypothetical protein